MFRGHYEEWREARMRGIDKYIDTVFLKNKTLLELGAGYGDLGYLFSQRGCKVTCSDGRGCHLRKLEEKYPNLQVEMFDCDADLLNKSYDIILHWGVLYHLEFIDRNLKDVCEHCNYLFLETEICDTNDSSVCLKVNEERNHLDQAANGIGSRPSPTYVEKLLNDYNFNYCMIQDDMINSQYHTYTSPIEETKSYNDNSKNN